MPVRQATTPQPPLALGRAVVVLSLAYTGVICLIAGLDASTELWSLSDPLDAALTWSFIVTSMAVWAVTNTWLDRSRQFAQLVAPEFRHVRGTLGTWWGWLVPLLELWFPYQAVRDVRAATSRGARRRGLALWWAAWLAYTLATSTYLEINAIGDDGRTVAAVALVVALYPWLRIVGQISTDQRARLADVRRELVAT